MRADTKKAFKEKIEIQWELERTIYRSLTEYGNTSESLDAYFRGLSRAYEFVLDLLESEDD